MTRLAFPGVGKVVAPITARPMGSLPTGQVVAAFSVPFPFPVRTLTVASWELATATSCLPSPLKSAMATAVGVLPTEYTWILSAENPPLPSPDTTAILLLENETARSEDVELCRFPIAMEVGLAVFSSPGRGTDVVAWNVPLPLPNSSVTVPPDVQFVALQLFAMKMLSLCPLVPRGPTAMDIGE